MKEIGNNNTLYQNDYDLVLNDYAKLDLSAKSIRNLESVCNYIDNSFENKLKPELESLNDDLESNFRESKENINKIMISLDENTKTSPEFIQKTEHLISEVERKIKLLDEKKDLNQIIESGDMNENEDLGIDDEGDTVYEKNMEEETNEQDSN